MLKFLRLLARDAGVMEPRSNARLANRNLNIRTNLKRQFEDGEITLARLMRTMGGLWTKTQAQRKEAAALRQALQQRQQQQQPAQNQEASLNVEVRNVLQSVTDNADIEAPEARLGRGWGETAQGAVRRGGGGRGRPGRGRGAGRGRGGRVEGGLRGTCPRCGGDYARSYLWYHSRRCVVEDVVGAGGENLEVVAEHAQVDGVQGAGVQENEGVGAEESESDDETGDEEEETDDQDILDEVDEMERTVFASPTPRRTSSRRRSPRRTSLRRTSIFSSPSTRARARGQKRTAMSVSSDDEESESAFVPPPAQRLRRRGLISDITFSSVASSPTPHHPAVAQPADGLLLSFDASAETRELADEIHHQQLTRRVAAARPLRLRSQDTPEGNRILDIGEERLRGVVIRLAGRGLTPVDASTPAEENVETPAHPDVSAVLQPIQLGFRYKIIAFISCIVVIVINRSTAANQTDSGSQSETSRFLFLNAFVALINISFSSGMSPHGRDLPVVFKTSKFHVTKILC